MITPREISRLVQGLTVVVEEFAKANGSALSIRAREASLHATDLARLLPALADTVTRRASGSRTSVEKGSRPVGNAPNEGRSIDNQRLDSIDAAILPKSSREIVAPSVVQSTAQPIRITQSESDQKEKRIMPPITALKTAGPATAGLDRNRLSAETRSPARKEVEEIKTASAEARSPVRKEAEEIKTVKQATKDLEGSYRSTSRVWREKHVPSTAIERVFGFGSLAARLAIGTVTDSIKHIGTTHKVQDSLVSDANAERLARTLCEMRGAALKLGQMLSIQDESVLPPTLVKALERVRQGADVMPRKQLHKMLQSELGPEWRSKLQDFDENPIAAASIGQVHRAVLLDGTEVAMKIQYPGVADSIDSDLSNLKRLVTYTNLLPKGLYVDEIIRVGKEELKRECNYTLEAENQERYRQLIADSESLHLLRVPKVYKELSTKRILTSEFVDGVAIDKLVHLPLEKRNEVARCLLELTIKELFQWRFMQTDPNWGNYLYDMETGMVSLIDFGASRTYDKEFVDEYIKIVWSAAERDLDTLLHSSRALGFLTGDESPSMVQAHQEAALVVGEPFRQEGPFDFAGSKIVVRLSKYGDTFMKDRLTPPPQEAYSLHRKLAGAFLICIKLQAVIPCRDILQQYYANYAFDGAN